METNRKAILSMVCFLVVTLLTTGIGQAVVIDDRAGSAIYWGGKYVNVKPSGYRDVIGSRSAVDQMEVIVNGNVMTVKITGPYFFNYAHNIKHTRDAAPGDLYISSRGWKVAGRPPYTGDIFEASEGWDYVVSFEKKKVYTLRFSDIVMTSPLPYVTKYRAHQAWRGGYGDYVADAAVTLTETGLTFIFTVRDMRLESKIGLHWTMKCGNDIIEGNAPIAPVAMPLSAEPAEAEEFHPVPIDVLVAEIGASELPAAPIASGSSAVVSGALPSAAGGFPFLGPLLAAAAIPVITFGSNHNNESITPGSGPGGPVEFPPGAVSGAVSGVVPEPSIALLLLAGLSGILTRKRPAT
ncbi:MAG TPA: PEP-CTERM sorting domain-containing protein [Syntrophorhabdales bacterium]|nr:PEP-CTERM sorting domain-containing protein [Syntrophorhabdales bacterium]